MTTARTPRCRAKGGVKNCTKPNCPEKQAAREAFYGNTAQQVAQQNSNRSVAKAAAQSQKRLSSSDNAKRKNHISHNQFGLPEIVVEAFTEADCWALAKELRRQTGWEIIGIGHADWHADHMGVLTPDGRILDITGLHDEREWFENWNAGYTAANETFTLRSKEHFIGLERVYEDQNPKYWAAKLLDAALR